MIALSLAMTITVAISACGSSGGRAASKNTADSPGLAFASCMRSHGVSNFPDPGSGGSIQITPGSGVDSASPAFRFAQDACSKLQPGSGPASGPPDPQAWAKLLKISRCMRAHGISHFPDPRLGSPPASLIGYSLILGSGGYLLAIPSSVSTQSPEFQQAAVACNFGPPRRGVRTPV